MIKLFRRAQRTDTLRVAKCLSEFGKVVFVHIKVSLVSGICHTIGGTIEEQYLHKRRKRNQKHTNKVTYSNPCSKTSTLTGRAHRIPPDRHEVQRPFFPALEKYLHLVSESHNITPYTKQEDRILRTFRQRWADAVGDLSGPGLTRGKHGRERQHGRARQHTLLCSLSSIARRQGTESPQRGMLAV